MPLIKACAFIKKMRHLYVSYQIPLSKQLLLLNTSYSHYTFQKVQDHTSCSKHKDIHLEASIRPNTTQRGQEPYVLQQAKSPKTR